MTTSSADIRRVLETLMVRNQWYTIQELEDLALTVLLPDAADLVVREYVYDEGHRQYPEWVFRRQVKNAVGRNGFRAEDHPAEYQGGQGGQGGDNISQYRIPGESDLGVESIDVLTPEEIAQLGGSEQPNHPHFSNDGWGAEQYVLNDYIERGFVGNNVRSRNLGFDLLVRPEDADQAGEMNYLFIEVKSCSNGLTRPLLTENEWAAAQEFGDQYRVVCVDNWDGVNGVIVVMEGISDMNPDVIQRMNYRLHR